MTSVRIEKSMGVKTYQEMPDEVQTTETSARTENQRIIFLVAAQEVYFCK